MPDQMGTGNIPGLDQAMIQALRAYRPATEGVSRLDPFLHVVLPLPEWYIYSWVEAVDVALEAGESDRQAGFTVPQDERVWIENVRFTRTSGDNTLDSISVTYPLGYGSGGRVLGLLSLSSAGTSIYWPDIAGRQTVNYAVDSVPLLLEPGTTVDIDPTGAGVAASVVALRMLIRRMKVVRAQPP